jgi:aspartate racemase
MKTIGLIGGITWESTVEYYKILNREIQQRLGGAHSAKLYIYSFDFDEILKFNKKNEFDAVGRRLAEESVKLEKQGADFIVLGANTAHRWVDFIQSKISIPIVHIADATGKAIQQTNINHVLLLGTKYTMEGTYIKDKLQLDFDIEVTVPDKNDRDIIHDIIFDELVMGEFNDSSTKAILDIIQKFDNVQGVILGCTELPLIIHPEDSSLPLFDTTVLHAKAAVDFALK